MIAMHTHTLCPMPSTPPFQSSLTIGTTDIQFAAQELLDDLENLIQLAM